MEKKIIACGLAPKALGPYCQAVETGGFVFCSGMIGINPETNTAPEGIEAQARQVMENIKGLLSSQGLTLDHIVKTTIFLKNMDDFAKVNEIYGSYFTKDPPARSTVEVSRLPKDLLIEIESIVKL